ncbi:RNase PH-related exoribonuclease [Caldisphaera lagunensis DSM 15908]|uniref:Exosome complex component Rrp42 n=1 Tax=Caldisphaera lagunensis (strain DSM 15908 / JCM 11604 / ANMR 0165 / IC-154) TaxID=1056495 RepID=L0AAZ3_CALLD|nr:exosome complex protein Rrp42 [Caldisphaera lagunensis]AFZ70200.1 RNase PH-related exoribonuclease [Caldisphaera lagunensis DSM 15908]
MSTTPYRTQIIPKIKRDVYLNLYRKGQRADERDFYSPRKISIQTNVLEKANGSALVKLGNTQVLAGIKIEPGEPFADMPDEGVLQVHAELVPLASPQFEPGPPDENAIELARVIDRSLRDPKAVDLKSLVIRPGDKVWMLWLDLYILDYDGNLFDASMLASMAALSTARMPEFEEMETGEIKLTNKISDIPIKLNKRIVTVTTAKIENYIIVDPNLDEEIISDTRSVISFDENGNIVGVQKTGMGSVSQEELDNIVNISSQAAQVYFKLLNNALVSEKKEEGGK